jgi:glycosyltransferase involved in cell wall biosynthesis
MKISVVTVCRNAKGTIEDTIRSVACQTYEPVEHIIIDGSSTDGTQSIIRAHDDVVEKWVSEPDQGIYDAMNKGVIMATGEVIGFLNADDVFADSSILEQVARVFQDKTLQACYADLVYVNKDDASRTVRYWKSSNFVKGAFSVGWCPAHPTFYVRRSVFSLLGYFDRSYKLAADADLMMRFLERGCISSLYVPHVWVTMRLGGQTNRNISNILRGNKEILKALRNNGLLVSPVRFAAAKLVSRISQRYLWPKVVSSSVVCKRRLILIPVRWLSIIRQFARS